MRPKQKNISKQNIPAGTSDNNTYAATHWKMRIIPHRCPFWPRMSRRTCCRRTYTEIGLILLVIMQFTWTWFLQHTTNWQVADKDQKTIILDRTTVVHSEEKHNNSWDLNSQQKFTAPGFLQIWNDMRREFITRLQMLLDDGAKGTDPRLIRLIQSNMFPPSNGVYKLSYHFDPGMHYQLTKDHFKKKGIAKGFFVECGGLDGERSSTTYDLEKEGWKGLLIEADPDYFFQSLGKNRRSWKLNAALCPSSEPKIVKFKEQGNSGGGKLQDEGMPIPCLPLPLILKALNRTRVDFLSLDVEGTEMEILRSLPYDHLDIEAINLEYIHNKEKPPSFKKFMASVGYTFVKQIYEVNAAKRVSTFDLYFVKMDK